MLAKLEAQYEEIQGQNIKSEVEYPEDEGEEPEGYQVIEDGDDGPDMLSDQEEIEGEENQAVGTKDAEDSTG